MCLRSRIQSWFPLAIHIGCLYNGPAGQQLDHGKAVLVGWTTYFVQGETTKNIKIGKTKDGLPDRLKDLQGSSPDRLVCLTTVFGDREDSYHVRFNHLWSHGEWFKPGQDLLDFIASLPKSRYAGLSVHIEHRGGQKASAMSRAILAEIRRERLVTGLPAYRDDCH